MVWARSLPPASSFLSAVTLRPTESPGKEPACPLLERKSFPLWPHERVGEAVEGHAVRPQPTFPKRHLGAGAALGLGEGALGRGQHRHESPPARS